MAKRGLNIYKRKDGRWEGRYKCGYDLNGKTKYRSVYASSYSAVKILLEQKKANSINCCSCKCTVGELLNLWIADIKNKVKDSTYANYIMKLKKHILPYFSGMKYDIMTAQNVNNFIYEKLESGLSENYVSDIVVLIKSAAEFGSRNFGYINRIKYVTLPKSSDKSEQILFTYTELQQLRTELINMPSYNNIGILLASVTGIRIGELCALKWKNISLDEKIITINQTVERICNTDKCGTNLTISAPNSRSSIRQIPIPDFIIPILERVIANEDCYLLSGTEKIIEPRTLQYRFKSLLKRLNLPIINFHKLRHQFATDCIALGIDVKTLSNILGHSSVEITLNRYVHSTLERERDFMEKFSKSIKTELKI